MSKKRLVICCDGTWNDADSGEDFTNVVRISRAIKAVDEAHPDKIKQIVYYHSGVGSEGDKLTQIIGGATGLGLSRNVRDAYTFLANNYCDGDELFLFGFSRGAYTARSIAGLIGWAGILHKVDMDDFALLWEEFKTRHDPGAPKPDVNFPERHAQVPIRCIGVWDTVGALGIPGKLNQLLTRLYAFHDTELGGNVEHAFQALAIDEHRGEFQPALWTRKDDAPATHILEQVWFAGAHSNVGGGYDEHGLSDIALAWMADRVSPMLAIDEDYLADRQDRRDGWALGRIYDSATGLFAWLGKEDRKVCAGEKTCESLHASVVARFSAGMTPNGGVYAPRSLPHGAAPSMQVAAFGPLEERLRWKGADPTHLGKSPRPAPKVNDPIMRSLKI